MSKLYFFRHAQASYLSDNYDQLSSRGEQQSAALGKYLVSKNKRFDKVFVGPLSRQQHTFEIVADTFAAHKIPVPLPVYLPELKEHLGPQVLRKVLPELIDTVPEIQKRTEEMQKNPALRKRNSLLIFQYFMLEWVEGNFDHPELESWRAFRSKVKNGLDTILQSTAKGETVGIFTSGGTISSIAAEALQLQNERRVAAMNFAIRNTSFSTFFFSKNQFNLLSLNELPHLEEDLITFV